MNPPNGLGFQKVAVGWCTRGEVKTGEKKNTLFDDDRLKPIIVSCIIIDEQYHQIIVKVTITITIITMIIITII